MKSSPNFWPITCFSVFPAQFWIFSKLLKHSKHCQVLAMFGMFETLRQLIDQKPSQWIKFQDWEPDKQRLEFKTVAGNKEHKFIGQKLGEDFAKFLWPSQNIWTLLLAPRNLRPSYGHDFAKKFKLDLWRKCRSS